MKETVITKTSIFEDYLDKNNLVKMEAVRQFILNERELFIQRYDKRYKDFYLSYNRQIDWISREVVSKLGAYNNLNVAPIGQKAEVHGFKESTLKRNQINLYDLAGSPDYTTLFFASASESDQVYIEYSDHRQIEKYMIYNLRPNMYLTFNSDLNYYFKEKQDSIPRIILTLNYQKVL
jgi:hypothetical protein